MSQIQEGSPTGAAAVHSQKGSMSGRAATIAVSAHSSLGGSERDSQAMMMTQHIHGGRRQELDDGLGGVSPPENNVYGISPHDLSLKGGQPDSTQKLPEYREHDQAQSADPKEEPRKSDGRQASDGSKMDAFRHISEHDGGSELSRTEQEHAQAQVRSMQSVEEDMAGSEKPVTVSAEDASPSVKRGDRTVNDE